MIFTFPLKRSQTPFPGVTTNTKTLIDNVFSNMTVLNIISGNLTASISDHFPQFLAAPNIFFNASYPKIKYYERN